MKNTRLCRFDEINERASRGFDIALDGQDAPLELFVVRKNDQVYAYKNSCPHTGVNLEWMPDQFLDIDGSFIQCATHGALFRIEDGYCVRGPCAGDCLESLAVSIINGEVQLDIGPV